MRLWYGLALRVSSVVLYLIAGRTAFAIHDWPAASLCVLTAGVVASIALWSAARTPVVDGAKAGSSSGSDAGLRHRARVGIIALVFATALATSYLFQLGLSTPIQPDTVTYWTSPSEFVNRSPGLVPLRTPLYSVLFVIVQLLGGSGRGVLLVQHLLRAAAAAAAAWALADASLMAAAVVGILLAIDPVSASLSVGYLSESVSSSSLLLAVVVAVVQLSVPSRRRARQLFAAGLLFGAALLVRPTTAALIGVAVAAYAARTRSLRAPAWAAAGYGIVALVIALFNYARSGLFLVVAMGVYFAFPLFIQHLLDPHNGRASRTIHMQLMVCDPSIDYSTVTLATANEFVYTKLRPCTLKMNGGDARRAYELYARAYREAFQSHPFVFTGRLAAESARFLSTTVSYYTAEVADFSHSVNVADACARKGVFSIYQPELMTFVCPLPKADPAVHARIIAAAFPLRMVYQPYLYAYDPRLYIERYEETSSPELSGAAAVLFFIFAAAIARRPYRPMIVAAAVVIVYTAAVTAFGQVTMRRYVAPLSPFFLIIAGLFVVTLVEEALAFMRASRAAARSGDSAAHLMAGRG